MDNNFNQTVASLFKGMDSFMSTKTVVGEPTKIGDTIILPLVDVNFGVAAGAFAKKEKGSNSAAGGMGGKMSPSAVLVIQNGYAKIVTANQTQSTVGKIFDAVPEVVNRISSLVSKKNPEEEAAVAEAVDDLGKEEMI
ncbi:MAG: sporulation protein [Lachnospiraceae bacterium]|nr:sporulation protein [Lachnospiraceae bacterium]